MRVTCILCDKPFVPDDNIVRRLQKQPHRLVLCPACHQLISNKTALRHENRKKRNHLSSYTPPKPRHPRPHHRHKRSANHQPIPRHLSRDQRR